MKKTTTASGTPENIVATARATNLPISTKHSVEICTCLRYRTTADARKLLEEVVALKRPLPFRRFNKDMGHKAGMAAGRFPQKAAKQFLHLIKSVEANAHFKGLDTAALTISHIAANRAPRPQTGGRLPHRPKRTHIEIKVRERKSGNISPKKSAVMKKEEGKDKTKATTQVTT